MPAGRNQIGFDDINYDGVSLPIDNSTITHDGAQANGIPVALTGRSVTVVNSGGRAVAALCADGDAIFGRLMRVTADGFCAVAHRGFVPFAAGVSATVTPMRRQVGALGGAGGTQRGYIRDVLAATTAEQARGRIVAIDNNDLNNVMCDLG